jgi:ATP-binding cassette subfamily B protein
MSEVSAKKKIFDVSLLLRIIRYAAPYKGKFYFSIFLAIFLAAMAPVRPLLIQFTIGKGLTHQGLAYFIQGPGGFLIEITIIQILLLLFESASKFFFSFTTANLGQSVVRDLRLSIYQKILSLQLRQFDKTPIGTLTTRTISDIESVNDIFSDGFIPIISDILSIISVLIYMFWADWRLTLVCLAPFPILIVATYFFKESVNKSFVKVRNAVAALNAFVQEHITGMLPLQAFAAEGQEFEKFKRINQEHRNANIKAIFAYSVFFPLVELVSALSVSLLVWWGAKNALDLPAQQAGSFTGVITSFILCLNLLFRPLRILADKFNVLQMGMIAGERIFKVLDNKDVMDNRGQIDQGPISGKMEFQQVWFAYEGDQYVLKDVTFQLEAGETLAVVGHTGSGKTSLVSLINRLYPINKGNLLIDGKNIEEYELSFLRSKIGLVLQDVFLFSGSVRDNLTLRNKSITDEQIQKAAQLIGIHDFIEKLPGGYGFQVMERGATLSLGQRQLISFLRALLYDPAILVLDEATSSVDTETEQLIQQAIDKLIAGRTSIIIAHRLSTVRKADKILVLDKGEIREMGTHQELLALKGYYHQLYHAQFQAETVQ